MNLLSYYGGPDKATFETAVRQTANILAIDPEWLLVVFMMESSMNPAAVNSLSGATGLIQFMPSTATSLGTTTAALKAMNGTQQMPWVEKYFLPYKGKMKDLATTYMAVFFPAAIGKPDTWIFSTSSLSAQLIAKWNIGIDLDKDGQITVDEFRQYINNYLKKKALI